MTLQGKRAIVTGAGRGLGKGIAVALAAEGVAVGVTDIDPESAEATVKVIADAGGTATSAGLDVADAAAIGTVFADLVREMQGLDILVNAAGIQTTTRCIDYTEENWDRQLDVNLRGTFFCCQAAARVMIEQHQGKIVNICSTSGFVSSTNTKVAYDTSKGGVRHMTVSLGAELSRHGINVNAVAPGTILTEMTRPMLQTEADQARFLAKIPLGRVGEIDDVAGPVLFLCSPAADYVVGHTLVVDGGWLL